MSAVKIALQQNQNRGKRKKTDMSAEVSPDSKCPICLDIFNNISYLDLCLHKFCFRCIHEWSKNKAECPLCKQPFNSIYHSIKSEQDFKKYDLRPTDNGSFGTFGGVRFRYRTTLTGVHRQMQRTTAPPENGVMFEASANQPPQRQDRYIRRIMTKLAAQKRAASEGRMVNNLREQEMINFRKELYRQGVRVRCVRDGGRSRDTSAEFYRRNPACLHRLVPWLKRELSVLYGAHGSLVNIVQHIVMSRITRYDVEDGAMQEELRPFLQGCTEHFLHEFINFAKSPFNMEAYDQHAIYDCPGPSSTDDNSSNSSVIAISEDEEDQSVELDPPGDSSSINLSNSFWDDETPGPSYSTRTEPSRIERLSLPDSDADSSLEGETQEFQASPLNLSPLNQKASTQDNDSFNSDSEDCIIVGFVKATTERTPELVQLSSDSSDDSAVEDDKEVPHLPQHIRFTSISPTVSQISDQSGAGQSEKTDGIHRPDSKERHRASCGKHKTHRENGDKDSFKESHRSRNKDHKRRRRSQSGEHRHPVTSYSREKSRSYSSRDDSYYKRRDSHLSHKAFSHSNRSHSGSYYYLERDNRQYASYNRFSSCRSYFQSSSRSRESRRRDRGRSQSRTYSSSRSPSVKRKSHHEKPGGKRKYKTRHLEEPYDGAEKDSSKHKKKDKERHHKKSKEEPRKSSRSRSVELVHMESSPERSKRHRKKKKKHKKKSKRHKSNERREKCSPAVITIDTDSDNGDNDNRAIQASNSNMDNSPNKATQDLAEPDSLNISS